MRSEFQSADVAGFFSRCASIETFVLIGPFAVSIQTWAKWNPQKRAIAQADLLLPEFRRWPWNINYPLKIKISSASSASSADIFLFFFLGWESMRPGFQSTDVADVADVSDFLSRCASIETFVLIGPFAALSQKWAKWNPQKRAIA